MQYALVVKYHVTAISSIGKSSKGQRVTDSWRKRLKNSWNAVTDQGQVSKETKQEDLISYAI